MDCVNNVGPLPVEVFKNMVDTTVLFLKDAADPVA